MRLGIFAKTFSATDPVASLAAVREAGYVCTQFNMRCAGLAELPDEIPDAVLDQIAAASRASGVVLAALSGTYNMIHPDPAIRARGMRRLGIMLAAASALGAKLVTLCTGTRDLDDQWRAHPDNAKPEAWADLRRAMEQAARLAEQQDVTLGIEPEQANVVVSAEDALRLIREIGSRHLRVVLDPANLFERADRPAAARIVAQAVETLAGHVVMAHAKDRRSDGMFATAGTGVVDFPDFLSRLRATGFDGPLIAHGLSAAEAPGVASFLASALAA